MLLKVANQKPSVPFWNEKPENLFAGIEQERFIFHENGTAPTLDEIKSVFENLISNGFIARKLDYDGRPLAVNQDSEFGYLSIKNDFATHIVEAAFPPISDSVDLMIYMDKTWLAISRAASTVGLRIQEGALISQLPPRFQLVPHERREWLPNRVVPKVPSFYWHKYFNVLMCSTQVHLNILDRKFYTYLPAFYSHEYLVPLLFSNSPVNGKLKAHCARPLIWRDSFDNNYQAFAIPKDLPTTPEQYDLFLKRSSDFQRDYTFIAPRSFGSAEFRTACAQDTLDQIMQVAVLRMAIVIAASVGKLPIISGARDYFYEVCQNGTSSKEVNSVSYQALSEGAHLLPARWRKFIDPTLERLKRIS